VCVCVCVYYVYQRIFTLYVFVCVSVCVCIYMHLQIHKYISWLILTPRCSVLLTLAVLCRLPISRLFNCLTLSLQDVRVRFLRRSRACQRARSSTCATSSPLTLPNSTAFCDARCDQDASGGCATVRVRGPSGRESEVGVVESWLVFLMSAQMHTSTSANF
jgi:hypothetical protein